MEKSVGKRGLSPVIASVFLVLLVLVLAAMIFLWARGFIGEQIEKFGAPIEESCKAVSFEVYRDGSMLEVVNKGNVDIHSMEIKMTRGGNSETMGFDFAIDVGKSVRDYVTFQMSDGGVPDSDDGITIYPVLLGRVPGEGKNNVFTCLDSGVIV